MSNDAMARKQSDRLKASLLRPSFPSLSKYGIVAVLGMMLIIIAISYPSFYTMANLRNLGTQNAAIGIVAVGATYVIICGGFDLSVGSTLALSAVVYGSLDGHVSMALALAVALGVGAIAGFVNGLLVSVLAVNPFVATLGTASAYAGLAALYTGSNAQILSSHAFLALGSSTFIGLPVSICTAVAIIVMAGIVLSATVYGRQLYAVGGNAEAARLVGMRIKVLVASTYVFVGICAGLAGVITASQIGVAQANYGSSVALDSIAIVVIGGTALTGGEGAVWRSAIGLLILGAINNIFQTEAVDPSVQAIVKGTLVVVAVAGSNLARRRT